VDKLQQIDVVVICYDNRTHLIYRWLMKHKGAMSTLWRNWDFGTEWQPEHFPHLWTTILRPFRTGRVGSSGVTIGWTGWTMSRGPRVPSYATGR